MCANSRALSSVGRDQRQGGGEKFGVGAGRGRCGGECAAKGARAGHGAEKAERVPRHRVQPGARAPVRARYRG